MKQNSIQDLIVQKPLSKVFKGVLAIFAVIFMLTLALPVKSEQGLLAPPIEYYEREQGIELAPECFLFWTDCFKRNMATIERNLGVSLRNTKITTDYRVAIAGLLFDSLGLGVATFQIIDQIKKNTMPVLNDTIAKVGPQVLAITKTLGGGNDPLTVLPAVAEKLSVLTEFTPLLEELKKIMELAPGVITPLTKFTFNLGNVFAQNQWSPKRAWGANLAASSTTIQQLVKLINEQVMPLVTRANAQLVRTIPAVQKSLIKVAALSKQFSTLIK